MSEITVVEFEKRQAHLSSELDAGPPYTVHGIALGSGDITRGASGVKKMWPEEELKKAAESLEGRNLVVDHNNDASGVIGKVTKAGFKQGVGVLYEAELFDSDLAKKISNGLLEVSVRGYHKDVDEMKETEDGAKIVEDIKFDNLSVVPSGASPSNTLEMGPAEELSVAALSEYVDTLDYSEALQDKIQAGDFVQWDGMHGIVITMPDNGEVDVDVYEKSDGKWRSIGQTKTVSVDSLDMWDVDESNIGKAKDNSGSSGNSESNAQADEVIQQINKFVSNNSEQDSVSKLVEWSDSDMLMNAANRYAKVDGHSLDDSVADFTAWYKSSSKQEEQMEELAGLEVHDPTFSGTSTGEWNAPALKDFGDSPDLGEVAKHFLVSQTGFPPENFTDLALPVVSPDGNLNLRALRNAKARAGQVSGLSGDALDRVDSKINNLANDNFDSANFEQGANDRGEGAEEILDTAAERKAQSGEDRNPDGAFDDEYEEASADEGSVESDVEELQEWEFHEVSWDGTTEGNWSSPSMQDFNTDDLGEIASHFLISQTGFPPENFTDLALPVVEPNGDLNVNALAAVKGGRGVSAVKGLSSDMEKQIVDYVNNLANEHFDRNWGMEQNMASREVESEQSSHDPVSESLDLINIYLRANGRDERDSVDKMLGWLFSSTDVPTEKMAAFRIAANAFLDQQGGADSFDAVDVEGFRSWLLTQGGQTNDGTHAASGGPTSGSGMPRVASPVHVLSGDDLRTVLSVGASETDELTNEDITNMTDIEEELAELDEPVAVEKSDFESLQEKADRFDDMSENIEALRERTDVLDSVDRDDVDALAESDDPVVLESAEYEELTAEAEQVKAVYAEALSSEGPFSADDLVDKFSIEELREKYEEAGHDLEEELSADPKSGDPSEEELEERAEEENKSEEELAEEEAVADKQAELREKILGN